MIRRNDRDRRLAGLNDRRLSGPERAEPEFEQAEAETGGTETGIEKTEPERTDFPEMNGIGRESAGGRVDAQYKKCNNLSGIDNVFTIWTFSNAGRGR